MSSILRLFITGIAVLLAATIAFAETTDPLEKVRGLHDRLVLKGGDRRFPAEFASFKEAIAKAEAGTTGGAKNTDKLVDIALIKGGIIEEKLARSTVDDSDSNSSLLPDEQTAQPPPAAIPPLTDKKSPPPLQQPAGTSGQPATTTEELPADSAISCQTVYPGPNALLGGEQTYVVRKKETIKLVGAKLGLNWRQLAKENGLDRKKPVPLKPGQVLHYNNRRIVPKQLANGLLINIPDKMLYFFKDGKLLKSAPIAVGIPRVATPKPAADGTPLPEKEHIKWQTPTGNFTILAKTKDPTWNVPPSIQEEMRQKGEKVLVKVPPGKNNPLGKYALKTSLAGIMLHSTNMPASIYGFSSHGCIRVYPEHMEQLFKEINVKTRGEIIYKPVKLAVTDDGRVYLEVHRDVYNKLKDLRKEVQRLVKQNNITDRVDWKKVDQVLKGKTGIAEEITRTEKGIASAI